MKILVTVASRHGSTREIALAIAGELRAAGTDVDLREIETIASLDGYDAAIIGSAVYAGQWLPEARRFVERNRERLATIPVWLFSSGPIGADPWPPGDPPGVAELVTAIAARGHTIFSGKLDIHDLGFAERLIARVVHTPAGDFRDWGAISVWARSVESDLAAQQLLGAE
jgi:menaquinone-dependent protoporphyrinogen oxidase